MEPRYMGVAGEDLVAGTPVTFGNDGLIRVLRDARGPGLADPDDPGPQPRKMTDEETAALLTLVRGGWIRLELDL